MALKEIKVRLHDLEVGMYVCKLDRPWVETPYLLQGFMIKTQEDIDELLKHCDYVYVDVTLSDVKDSETPKFRNRVYTSDEEKEFLTRVKPRHYADKSSREEELEVARESHRMLANSAQALMEDIANNRKLELPHLRKVVTPMVDSVIRNPDAYAWLTRLKHKDNYAYNHAVSASIWAVAFGRHLGLPKKDLQLLAIGALMFDVGKVKLPDKLINNTSRYNQYEFKLVKQHVDYSLEIVSSINGIDSRIVEMVATHHERHNGNGYPRGLSGTSIPIFGRIAGIVDCYDAMISERPFATPMSPHDAVKKLYEWRNIDFQAELVEQFIQVVGIYPVGTIVELSDGRVGVIIAQNRVWRLRPKIMLLRDKNKESLANFDIIDLQVHNTDDNGDTLNIIKSVEPGMYGIDPEQFYL